MPDIPGTSDAAEVRRARRKFVAILRAEFRLRQRLAGIDWEEDVLQPRLRAFETRTVITGELPTFEWTEDDEAKD